MTTGERIRQLRIAQQMTQEVGVQKAAIYKYENGLIVNLKRSTIEKLALVLDTTPTYLMGMEDDEPEQTALTPAQASLLAVFNELNEEGQSKVIGYAEDLCRTGYYKKDSTSGMDKRDA